MNESQENLARQVFERHPEVGVAYFFGSRARGTNGLMSDYDFAVYADEHDTKKLSDIALALRTELAQVLKTDALDLVMLNTLASPELKYAIIQEGKVLLERESFRVRIEPNILNEYFDFRTMLRRYQLTLA
ncbi:MAG: nucleotidyltransferase domain-containing protein [Candidatus Moraniibacteriota bacterium]